MCGIAGIISSDISLITDQVLKGMAHSLAHRGPDGQAIWSAPKANAGFAHRRLCVIDTSEAAAQPMHYLDRFTIIYNGEIYNYPELRESLIKKDYHFYTSSDTEVILAAFAHYRESCVEHFDGMFSFAIWDEKEQLLFCARDRFGEKPFFYFHDEQQRSFYFGSEMKALTAAGVEPINNNKLFLQFLAFGYTGDAADMSATFDARIKKLPAAHWLKYDFSAGTVTIKKYWDVSLDISPIPMDQALEKFNELLAISVKRRLRSDVTVGASLSGGLDSSSIVATIASFCTNNDLKTFTAIFPGYEKDEAEKARIVSEKFHFKNHTVSPGADGFIQDLEKLIYHQEEPFTSGSVYAQYKIFELAAKEGVTVLLDGQGADEVLAGYDKYRNWKLQSLFPKFTSAALSRRQKWSLANNKSLSKDFISSAGKVSTMKPVVTGLNDLLYFNIFRSGLEELLRYADRNSMAHGREVRLPFLNHELVKFVFSLPDHYKIRDGYTKWILRKAIDSKLPSEIVWQKRKVGFEPPQKDWMEQKGIKEYIEEAKRQLVSSGILNSSVLKEKSIAHGAYERDTSAWRWMVTAGLMRTKKGSE